MEVDCGSAVSVINREQYLNQFDKPLQKCTKQLIVVNGAKLKIEGEVLITIGNVPVMAHRNQLRVSKSSSYSLRPKISISMKEVGKSPRGESRLDNNGLPVVLVRVDRGQDELHSSDGGRLIPDIPIRINQDGNESRSGDGGRELPEKAVRMRRKRKRDTRIKEPVNDDLRRSKRVKMMNRNSDYVYDKW
ncbi:uncharacterized protein LOC134216627 [Armigeres subalbatus]